MKKHRTENGEFKKVESVGEYFKTLLKISLLLVAFPLILIYQAFECMIEGGNYLDSQIENAYGIWEIITFIFTGKIKDNSIAISEMKTRRKLFAIGFTNEMGKAVAKNSTLRYRHYTNKKAFVYDAGDYSLNGTYLTITKVGKNKYLTNIILDKRDNLPKISIDTDHLFTSEEITTIIKEIK